MYIIDYQAGNYPRQHNRNYTRLIYRLFQTTYSRIPSTQHCQKEAWVTIVLRVLLRVWRVAIV